MRTFTACLLVALLQFCAVLPLSIAEDIFVVHNTRQHDLPLYFYSTETEEWLPPILLKAQQHVEVKLTSEKPHYLRVNQRRDNLYLVGYIDIHAALSKADKPELWLEQGKLQRVHKAGTIYPSVVQETRPKEVTSTIMVTEDVVKTVEVLNPQTGKLETKTEKFQIQKPVVETKIIQVKTFVPNKTPLQKDEIQEYIGYKLSYKAQSEFQVVTADAITAIPQKPMPQPDWEFFPSVLGIAGSGRLTSHRGAFRGPGDSHIRGANFVQLVSQEKDEIKLGKIRHYITEGGDKKYLTRKPDGTTFWSADVTKDAIWHVRLASQYGPNETTYIFSIRWNSPDAKVYYLSGAQFIEDPTKQLSLEIFDPDDG